MVKQLDYKTIRELFQRFQAADAAPEGELDHVNVYTLVVAVARSSKLSAGLVSPGWRALTNYRLDAYRRRGALKLCQNSPMPWKLRLRL